MNILIYRPDNIGDVLLFSGGLRHIRNLYPNARISLAVQKQVINLMELCPYVDEVVAIESLSLWLRLKKKGVRGTTRLERMFIMLDGLWNRFVRHFDVIIYPVRSHQEEELKLLSALSASKVTGITGCSVNAPDEGFPNHLKPESLISSAFDISGFYPWRHELSTHLDFLKFLGCDVHGTVDIQPEVWLSPSDRSVLSSRSGTKPLIGLIPGASIDKKVWDVSNYSRLASIEADFAIFGGPAEKTLSDQVEQALRRQRPDAWVRNLAGKTTLRELYLAISSCNAIFSMDTGGIHMAITAGVPTVGITGGWNYRRFLPWGNIDRTVILIKDLDCFYCGKHCRQNRIECIQEVSSTEVSLQLQRLLNLHINYSQKEGLMNIGVGEGFATLDATHLAFLQGADSVAGTGADLQNLQKPL